MAFLPAVQKKPSFSSQLGESLGQGLQRGVGQALQHGQNMELQNTKTKSFNDEVKRFEKINSLQGALQTIDRMKQIGSGGNLGRGSAIKGFFGGETAKDRGEYEQLGKSLIQLSTNIPIRNKLEFETLAGRLYNPSLPDSEREGILTAMQSMIENSLQGVDQSVEKESKSSKMQFNIKNPEHKSKRDQLLKKYGNDRKKVEEILLREFNL